MAAAAERTTEDLRALRERYDLSSQDCHRAASVADARFNGDLRLGALWVHANAFAVNVKGDRAAWNDDWARRRLAEEQD